MMDINPVVFVTLIIAVPFIVVWAYTTWKSR